MWSDQMSEMVSVKRSWVKKGGWVRMEWGGW